MGAPPHEPVYVVVAAPHTTNWDFPAMLTVAWACDVSPLWLGKKELFTGPLGGLLRHLGGIPVDRENPEGLVEEIGTLMRSHDTLAMVVPAEGTRSKGRYWKSGFHRIARDAGVPIALTFLDGPGRRGGWGPVFAPHEDIHEDMNLIRAFYADKPGLRPAHKTDPLLRSEDVASV